MRRLAFTRIWLALLLGLLVLPGHAPAATRSHGLSIFGPSTLKYKPGEPFAYLNPDAPIGGNLRLPGEYFTKLSSFGLTGSAPEFIYKVFDTLSIKSWDDDEPYSVYGLVAESFELADDKLALTIYLRPEARFADDVPLTADDVVFSYNLLFDPNMNPGYRLMFRNVRTFERIDDHTVKATFKEYSRDLPIALASLTIYPKHIYGVPGKDLGHDFNDVLPVGSGPYEVESYKFGERFILRRRDNYWAQNLPYCKGFFNWKRIEFQVYYDQFSQMEALKSGYLDSLTGWNPETFRRLRGSDIDRHYIVKQEFPLTRPSAMKCLAFNLRRPIFQDREVRKVIASLYDFEFINQNFYFGSQDRLTSYFMRQPHLRAKSGPAQGRVREILLDLAARHNQPAAGISFVPAEAIDVGTYDPGLATDGKSIPIEVRVRAANEELDRLGWRYDPVVGARRKGNDVLDFEINDSIDEGLYHYVETLNLAGIKARASKLSPLESQNRNKSFRFDMVHGWYDGRQAPGRELAQNFLSSQAAIPGSANVMGLKNPAIDEVLNVLLSSADYDEVGIYAQVFDRIMFANWYVVPKFWPRYDYGVYANFMGRPKVYCSGLWYYYNVIWFWWEDPSRHEQLEKARAQGVPFAE